MNHTNNILLALFFLLLCLFVLACVFFAAFAGIAHKLGWSAPGEFLAGLFTDTDGQPEPE